MDLQFLTKVEKVTVFGASLLLEGVSKNWNGKDDINTSEHIAPVNLRWWLDADVQPHGVTAILPKFHDLTIPVKVIEWTEGDDIEHDFDIACSQRPQEGQYEIISEMPFTNDGGIMPCQIEIDCMNKRVTIF